MPCAARICYASWNHEREGGMIVITGGARVAEANRAAVDFHFAQSYCHEFMEAARRLAETEPEIAIREVVVKEG